MAQGLHVCERVGNAADAGGEHAEKAAVHVGVQVAQKAEQSLVVVVGSASRTSHSIKTRLPEHVGHGFRQRLLDVVLHEVRAVVFAFQPGAVHGGAAMDGGEAVARELQPVDVAAAVGVRRAAAEQQLSTYCRRMLRRLFAKCSLNTWKSRSCFSSVSIFFCARSTTEIRFSDSIGLSRYSKTLLRIAARAY